MNGTQLRKWRTDHGYTLQDVSELLKGDANHTTISRWETLESGQKEIPQWATDKLLATTNIKLPLDELHELLDFAREENMPTEDIIGSALREYLQKRRNQPEIQTTPITAAGHKLTLYSTDVPAPAKVAEEPATSPKEAALRLAARHHDAENPLPPATAPAAPHSARGSPAAPSPAPAR